MVDSLSYVYLLWYLFRFCRSSIRNFPTVFPLRPLTLSSRQKSPAQTLTYWFKLHKASGKLPLLFIHGTEIGLYQYINFLGQVNKHAGQTNFDEDIDIAATEIMPLSFRIISSALAKQQMCHEIQKILERYVWTKCVLIAHSCGSIIANYLLRGPIFRLVRPLLLIGLVSILLSLPDVDFSFTCREPRQANELQLRYFVSTDIGVADTLARRFFWQENTL